MSCAGTDEAQVCPVCGHRNPPSSLFCARCTSPVAVVALSQLTPREQEMCLGRLMQVLGEAMAQATDGESGADPYGHDQDLWRAYLSAFWLRPETALVLYAEALAIRACGPPTGTPWLDLGCGDGVHAALSAGWTFAPSFDCFQALDLDAKDIYDHWDAGAFAADVTRAGRTIDLGVDIKASAVARARALGVFRQVHQADATRLPIPSASVKTIFSNMLRDLGEPLPAALAECRRVLRDDGVLLISAMTPAYARHLCFAPAARQAQSQGQYDRAQQLLRLDRGRSVFCQRQLSVEQWEQLLHANGLKVDAVQPIVGPEVIRFWDVGLRPFSLPLLRQREAWRRAGVLDAIKVPAVQFLNRMMHPLLRRLRQGEPCMNLLAVRKG